MHTGANCTHEWQFEASQVCQPLLQPESQVLLQQFCLGPSVPRPHTCIIAIVVTGAVTIDADGHLELRQLVGRAQCDRGESMQGCKRHGRFLGVCQCQCHWYKRGDKFRGQHVDGTW